MHQEIRSHNSSARFDNLESFQNRGSAIAHSEYERINNIDLNQKPLTLQLNMCRLGQVIMQRTLEELPQLPITDSAFPGIAMFDDIREITGTNPKKTLKKLEEKTIIFRESELETPSSTVKEHLTNWIAMRTDPSYLGKAGYKDKMRSNTYSRSSAPEEIFKDLSFYFHSTMNPDAAEWLANQLSKLQNMALQAFGRGHYYASIHISSGLTDFSSEPEHFYHTHCSGHDDDTHRLLWVPISEKSETIFVTPPNQNWTQALRTQTTSAYNELAKQEQKLLRTVLKGNKNEFIAGYDSFKESALNFYRLKRFGNASDIDSQNAKFSMAPPDSLIAMTPGTSTLLHGEHYNLRKSRLGIFISKKKSRHY